jgi:hypothetical protein
LDTPAGARPFFAPLENLLPQGARVYLGAIHNSSLAGFLRKSVVLPVRQTRRLEITFERFELGHHPAIQKLG